MFRDIGVVIRKELIDLSRDRRTLRSMAGILLGMPLVYVLLIGVILSQIKENMERTVQVGVVGCSHAASICDFLRENRVDLTPLNEVETKLIANRKFDVILSLPQDYEQALAEFRRPKIGLWYDEVEDKSSFAAKRMGLLLESWQVGLGYRRAILRGIDPSTLKPLQVEARSIKPEKGFGYSSVQLFMSTLLMACFMGTYHLAVDSVAGEKERHTLESLMQTAAPRTAFMLGKWLSIAVVGTIGMLASALIFKFLVEARPLQNLLGMASELSWSFVGKSVLICVPLILMATSLQFMIGTLSRSVKEAQTYTSLLSILGFLPASFANVLEKMPNAQWMPSLGQTLTLLRMGKDQPVNWLACLVASGATLLLAALFMLVVYRAFHNEKLFRSGT
ncbi:MAG TPA: ABC transporter permease [Oligoflexus sp.]|uniref:ABC transporter permease n=1 Tax=Oligoflexus sp. TaxID=1971216 RepID=UPI002D43D285|nr:ABC transporter permease [Oligoflexus sp.]HYX32068.1 ABC transporter permease [Oligoflexus sp.]